MLGIEAKKGVVFVIPEYNIIMRPVLLDEIRLQQQGLFFGGGGKVLYAFRPGHHGNGLGRQTGGTEIGQHTPAQNPGLAHINDSATGIPINVHPGREWNC